MAEAKEIQNVQTAEVAKVENKVAAVPTASYIAALLEAEKQAFLTVNMGMELDYVRVGESLKMNKKGVFVLRNDETTEFGDALDVVVARGETRYMLWGKKGSPEDGQIVVAEKTIEKGREMLQEFIDATPGAEARYSPEDVKINYVASVVMTQDIGPDKEPSVYLLFFPQTGAYSFGQYAQRVFKGDKSKNIPRHTGVNQVITRISNKEEQGAGTDTYLAYTFESVAMFKPEDFGIKQN